MFREDEKPTRLIYKTVSKNTELDKEKEKRKNRIKMLEELTAAQIIWLAKTALAISIIYMISKIVPAILEYKKSSILR